MKLVLSAFLLVSVLFGEVIKSGDNLLSLKVQDQFEKDMIISTKTAKIMIAFSKEKGAEIKTYLDANPNYLKSQNILYFADVSAAPSIITSIFMIPKFKEYNYSMGVIRDEELALRFPKKEGMITMFTLENGIVKDIEYKKMIP